MPVYEVLDYGERKNRDYGVYRVYDDCAEPRHESGLMALAQGFLNDKYGYRSYGGRCGNADNETFEHIHQHKRKR